MKKAICFGILVLLILGLGTQLMAEAETRLSFGVSGGWYSPPFGEVNDDYLEDVNDWWGTTLGFKGGPILGLFASYNFTDNFQVRGEISKFVSQTNDTMTISGWYLWYSEYYYWEETMEFDAELTVIPLILSGIYKFSSQDSSIRPYFGAGVAQFVTTLEVKEVFQYDEWVNGWHSHGKYSFKEKSRVVTLGAQILAGIEGKLSKNVRWCIEGRYTAVQPEVEMDRYWKTEIDLRGLTLSFGVECNI